MGLSHAGPPDYSESSRGPGPSYATPSPTPFSSDSPFHSAEAKSYKEDDRRHYSDGPSHPRTGPPKKVSPLFFGKMFLVAFNKRKKMFQPHE